MTAAVLAGALSVPPTLATVTPAFEGPTVGTEGHGGARSGGGPMTESSETAGGLPSVWMQDLTWEEVAVDEDDFEQVGAAFETTGAVTIGPVGEATARLMAQSALVDFGVSWMTAHR